MKALLHWLSYPLSILFYLLFGILLLLFDPIQRICLRIFGYSAHKASVDLFNGLLILILHVLGTTFSFKLLADLPKDKPVIIAANHQSMWDIPPLIWFLRRIHPKFISKKELGNRIPTISYNLKYGGSVLIDRKDSKQAMKEIVKIAHYISANKRSVVIFPEGTRSRDGVPKRFHRNGLRTLLQEAPDAWILPVSINNSWKLQRNGMFPIPLGSRLKFKVHEAFPIDGQDHEFLIDRLEQTIKADLEKA